jgi:formamidopyrimidine-DNA glycosylase
MPELPEVEMVARTLRPRLVGRRLVAVETSGLPLRRPVDAAGLRAACRNARVEAVRRIGKYLLVDLSSQQVLVAHLGMSGRLLFAAAGASRAPHTHVVFSLDDEQELRYVDPRRFGVLVVYPRARAAGSPELSVLGIDPLEPAFTVAYLAGALAGARRDLKGFLLDQSRIAGLGNIYACEAMFHAGLGPRRRTQRLGSARAARLHAAIQKVLTDGIANRGTSFSDYVDADGAAGANQNALAVYGREGLPCRRCRTPIRRIVQGARSTFYCPRCQSSR